jgi:hypothetical protein
MTQAAGWFSSDSRWFQTRYSIETFRRYHPGVECHVLFTGTVRDFARLNIPDGVQVHFQGEMHPYLIEKGIGAIAHGGYSRCLIAEFLLRKGYERVMVFDGDTETFAPMDDLWHVLESHNAIVTPHRIYAPPRDGKVMCLEQFALCGNYNAGFLGLRNTPETRGFVDWWMRESIDNPECNMSGGRFAEQGWLRFIADYLDKVHVCRDQGVNFAFWRYDNHYQFQPDGEGGWTVDGVPLRFFHYGALDFNDLGKVAIHHNRCRACPDLLAFFERYVANVLG